MKKAKVLVLVLTIILLLSGVAYARWTEQINILVLTKTAETELSYIDYTHRTESGSVSVSKGEKTQATVSFQNIEPGTGNSVTLNFKNTGTIPIDIDDIKVLYVGGYSNDNKHDITLTVTGYYGTNRFLQESERIFHWRSNSSSSSRDELVELPVNGTIKVICDVDFDEAKNKDNFGQSKKEDTQPETESKKIMENVSFVIEVSYSRFNEH